MTDSGSLQDSLAAMGFIELGLALTALSCYALAFSGALRLKIRGSAACTAFVAAGAFAALTNPWVHGVILIAIGVAGMGVFVAVVWGLSAMLGLSRRGAAEPIPELVPEEGTPGAAPAVVRVPPKSALHQSS